MKERHLPENIQIRSSEQGDVDPISELISLVPEALVPVEKKQIQRWIDEGRSLVAVNIQTGQIVAHQGLGHWELDEGRQATELRSAYTHPDWRRKGINTSLKLEMIDIAKKMYPDVPIVGFTEKPSKSRGILNELGFEIVELEDVPVQFFSICPKDCAMKNNHPCGCKVFVDRPDRLIE